MLSLKDRIRRYWRAKHPVLDSGPSNSCKEASIAAQFEIDEERHMFWFHIKYGIFKLAIAASLVAFAVPKVKAWYQNAPRIGDTPTSLQNKGDHIVNAVTQAEPILTETSFPNEPAVTAPEVIVRSSNNYSYEETKQACILAQDFYNSVIGSEENVIFSSFPQSAMPCLEVGLQYGDKNCELSFNLISNSKNEFIPTHTIQKIGRCASLQFQIRK